jgi:adenylate cyclase
MAPRIARVAIVGFLTALAGAAVILFPFGQRLELALGLNVLFEVRGRREVPPDVAVVSFSPVPGQITRWPSAPIKSLRSAHARLIEALVRQGAAVIAFDITFLEPGLSSQDRMLAEAIRRAGNVVLCEYLKSVYVPTSTGESTQSLGVNIKKLLPPVAPLARSAAALAPFPLPRVPVQVSRFWTFAPAPHEKPTLPVAAFEIYTADLRKAFRRLLLSAVMLRARELQAVPVDSISLGYGKHPVESYRGLLRKNPAWTALLIHALQSPRFQDLNARQKTMLAAIVALCAGDKQRYLNFYGPPGTVPTFSYMQILKENQPLLWQGKPVDLRGRAIFVGFSKLLRSEQKDGYYTVFSRSGGVDFSGVELAATAFANLVENRHVRSLSPGRKLAIVVTAAFLLAGLCGLLPPLWSGLAVLGGGLAYFAYALQEFKTAGLWIPVATPLFIQAPFAWLTTTLWKYADTCRERNTIKKAFGYYLPDHMVAELARDLRHIETHRKMLHGTCLLTDAERYTTLSEGMHPRDLSALMNRYFETLFQPVKAHGGSVSDVTGDAMLAIWVTARPDPAVRRKACLAALELAAAVDRFNRDAGNHRLPTRIGLHSGRVAVGNIGALDHFEYAPVGDVVNTTSRVEGLNKYLKTRVLVSRQVLQGVSDLFTREVGRFLLAGKSRPVTLYELMGLGTDASPRQRALRRIFAEALEAYRQGRWQDAVRALEAALKLHPDDGPAAFYLKLCREYRDRPPPEPWDGIIRLEGK